MNEKEEQNNNSKNKTRILIVDDHAIVREGLTMLLNQEPDLIVCAEAENAHQALEALKKKQIDLAIVDISLNNTDGIQLTREIKSQRPHLPVLILTIHDEAIYAERAFQAGAQGYITKRQATETIITTIHQMLSNKENICQGATQKPSENDI